MLAGKDKGRTGEVLSVIPKDDKALVRGVNQIRRSPEANPDPGGRDHHQGSADPPVRPIAIADPKDGKPTRVGFRVERTALRCASPRAREIVIDG